jgi:hypothetical protein
MAELSRFNPHSPHPERAVQAWQILVGMAMRGEKTNYLDLSKLMYGKEAAGVLDEILGHIAFYCKARELPQLNTLVVNKKTGTPGDLIPLAPDSFPAETKRVFEENWYDLHPPTGSALAEAYRDRPRKLKANRP